MMEFRCELCAGVGWTLRGPEGRADGTMEYQCLRCCGEFRSVRGAIGASGRCPGCGDRFVVLGVDPPKLNCNGCGSAMRPVSQNPAVTLPVYLRRLVAPFYPRAEKFERVGGGGLGEVYRFSCDGKHFAVKVLQQVDPACRARFRREAELLAAVGNPHVVKILHHGAEEQDFLIMEYVSGVHFEEWRKTRVREPREAIGMVLRICRAVASLHRLESPIIHRDLKPSNILIHGEGEEENPVLIDFGLAKSPRTGGGLTEAGDRMGTWGYAPPEQVHGRLTDHGPAGDVFSLGVILYETRWLRVCACSDARAFSIPSIEDFGVRHRLKNRRFRCQTRDRSRQWTCRKWGPFAPVDMSEMEECRENAVPREMWVESDWGN